jgi:hypothetical protein
VGESKRTDISILKIPMQFMKFVHITLKLKSRVYWLHAKSRGPCFWRNKNSISYAQLILINKKRKKCMAISCRTMPQPTQQTSQWYVSIILLRHVFGQQVIICGVWPLIPPHLNLWLLFGGGRGLNESSCAKSTFFARTVRQQLQRKWLFQDKSSIMYQEIFSEDEIPA